MIVSEQPSSLVERHVPEPWNGRIDAPILFLSSNPSIDTAELFPDSSWSDDDINDYFENRFGPEERWAKGHLYPLLKDGKPRMQYVKFWSEVNQRAEELLRRPAIAGTDYAMTEVVHCKSESEAGAEQALDECARLYLDRVIAASSARVIIVLGRKAERVVREQWKLGTKEKVAGTVRVGRLSHTFGFLPHPNARGKRTFNTCFRKSDLRRLQKLLSVS